MNFEGLLQQRLETLHREGRYRVFADLKRRRGFFPVADHFTANGSREVTVWCSNDYAIVDAVALLGRDFEPTRAELARARRQTNGVSLAADVHLLGSGNMSLTPALKGSA